MTPEDDLLRKTRALPRSIPPERDLWPGIASRLAATESEPAAAAVAADGAARPLSHRWQPLALAAGLLFAVTLAFWLGRGSDSASSANTPAGLQSARMPLVGLHATRLALAGSIEQRLDRLSPATRAVVLENLATINHALDDIDAALAAAPESDLDAGLLMAVYADQLVLLNSMNNTMNPARYAATEEIAL